MAGYAWEEEPAGWLPAAGSAIRAPESPAGWLTALSAGWLSEPLAAGSPSPLVGSLSAGVLSGVLAGSLTLLEAGVEAGVEALLSSPQATRPAARAATQARLKIFAESFMFKFSFSKKRFAPLALERAPLGNGSKNKPKMCVKCAETVSKKQHIAQLFQWTRRMTGGSGFVKKV